MARRRSEPRKRKRGTGGISQRSDGRYHVEWTDERGQRHQTTRASRESAEAWLAEQQGEARRGPPSTLGEWLLRWLAQQQPRLAHSSYVTYLWHVGAAEPIGHVRLTDVRPGHFRDLAAGLLAAGRSSGYIRTVLGTLARALEPAIDDELLARNPAAVALRGFRAPPQPERTFWNEAQVRTFLRLIEGHRYAPLYWLAATCGLRIGELSALQWRDVDLDGQALHVRQSFNPISGQIEPTKSRRSRRFRLSPVVVDVLRAYRTSLSLVGPYVVSQPHGRHVHPARIRAAFKALLRASDLPEIRVHDLRHAAGSILLHRGVSAPRVARVLGHASPDITLRVYAHALTEDEDAAALAIEDAFGAKPEPD